MEPQHESSSAEVVENENKEDTNIIQLLHSNQPALFIENLYGIFRFNLHDKELVSITRGMKFVCIVVLSIYVVLFSTLLRFPSALQGTTNIVDTIDEVPPILIMIQYIVSAIRTTLFFNQENIRLMTTLSDVDDKLHIYTHKNFYKRSLKTTVHVIVILLLVHVVVSVVDVFCDEDDIDMKKIVVLPIYMEQSLEISVFCLIIMMLTRRVNLINRYLTQFVGEGDDNKASVFYVEEKKECPKEFNFIGRACTENMRIRDLAVIYDTIGETCALINKIFNFQIFMTLFATFTYVVITIWSALYYYKNGENLSSLVTIIIWCVNDVCIIAFMSMTCERLLLARTETKVLVNKIIMNYDLPKTMRMQAKAFMELIEAWPLRIFVYDMFSVDITLMLKYISVATTYLIVIIQISHFV